MFDFSHVNISRVIPPLAKGQSPKVHDDDVLDSSEAGQGSGRAAFIVYEDAQGVVTQRRITVRKYKVDKNMLTAHCHERNAYRMFKVDNIISIADCYSGEILDKALFLARLSDEALYDVDPLLQRYLVVLVFLMRCDGEAHTLEREAIEDAVASYIMQFEISEDNYNNAIRYAFGSAPEIDDLSAALKYIAKISDGLGIRRRVARHLIGRINAVMAADSVVREEEFQAALAVVPILEKWCN